MQLQFTKEDDILLVLVRCERLDASVSPEFKAKVSAELSDDITHVIMDLHHVQFLDSSALGSMVSVVKTLRGRGTVTIRGAAPCVRSLFRLTHMDRVFNLEHGEPA